MAQTDFKTRIAPISVVEVSEKIYVGTPPTPTLQSAVTRAAALGGFWEIVIPHGYNLQEDIYTITGGIAPNIFIVDERYGTRQPYAWDTTKAKFTPGLTPAIIAANHQMNHELYVGAEVWQFQTIQSAVDFAVIGQQGGLWESNKYNVRIGVSYPGAEDIGSIVNGSQNVWIIDERAGQRSSYLWVPAQNKYVQEPAIIAGIGTNQINHYLYVGNGKYQTIQSAIDAAKGFGGPQNFCIIVGPSYSGSENITALGNGAAFIYIAYQHNDEWINYKWNGTNFVASDVHVGGDLLIGGDVYANAAQFAADVSVGGFLTLSADPIQPLEAATRHYVDQAIADSGNFVYPAAGVATSTGTAWGASINPATLATWPAAGVPTSTGTAWGASINPASLATYPAAGLAVSTGSAWTTPIDPANIAYLNTVNTFTQGQMDGNGLTVVGNQSPANIPDSLRLASSNTTHGVYFDGWGPSATTRGTLNFRQVASDGSNGLNSLIFDTAAKATFISDVTVGGIFRAGPLTPLSNRPITMDFYQNLFRLVSIKNDNTSAGAYDFYGYSDDFQHSALYMHMAGDSENYLHIRMPVDELICCMDKLSIQNRAYTVAHPPAIPNINSDGNSLIINSRASNGIYLNWENSTNSTVTFGDGAQHGVASVSSAGVISAASFIANGSAATITTSAPHINIGLVNGHVPDLKMCNNAAATDQKMYDMYVADDGSLIFRMIKDDQLGANAWMSVTRTGFSSASVFVSGTFNATSKLFQITHPQDPTKWLLHGCLEGPEEGVYYRGEGVTVDGKATITLPDYFEALTLPDQRTVQLTQIVEAEPPTFAQLAAGRVTGGQFTVYSSVAAVKFYWMVQAVRSDVPPLEVVKAKTEEASGPLGGTPTVPEPTPPPAPVTGTPEPLPPAPPIPPDPTAPGDAPA